MTRKNTQKKPTPKHEGPDHSSPYPVSRMAPPTQLVDLARHIEKADQTIAAHVNSKLKIISDQIKTLQDQAREILEKAKNDQDLHRVRCNFKRIPGKTYFLYVREDNNHYFSLLSPEDWHGKPPNTFVGSYRLEADMSWTPAEYKLEENRFDKILTDLLKRENSG